MEYKSDNIITTSDAALTFSFANTFRSDDASEYTLIPETQKKEKSGSSQKLAKLGEKDAILEKAHEGTLERGRKGEPFL